MSETLTSEEVLANAERVYEQIAQMCRDEGIEVPERTVTPAVEPEPVEERIKAAQKEQLRYAVREIGQTTLHVAAFLSICGFMVLGAVMQIWPTTVIGTIGLVGLLRLMAK